MAWALQVTSTYFGRETDVHAGVQRYWIRKGNAAKPGTSPSGDVHSWRFFLPARRARASDIEVNA